MNLLISLAFSLSVFLTCILLAKVTRIKNLKPLVALSAGGLFSLVFLDFLPHSLQEQPFVSGCFVILGMLIQYLFELHAPKKLKFLDKLVDTSQGAHQHAHILSAGASCSLAACLILCSFFDGIRFYSGLMLGGQAAVTLSVALFFHLISEGLILATLGFDLKLKHPVLMILFTGLCLSFLMGTLITANLFLYISPTLIFSIATGMLVYISFIHLLPFCLKNKYYSYFATGLLVFALTHWIFLEH